MLRLSTLKDLATSFSAALFGMLLVCPVVAHLLLSLAAWRVMCPFWMCLLDLPFKPACPPCVLPIIHAAPFALRQPLLSLPMSCPLSAVCKLLCTLFGSLSVMCLLARTI